MTRRQILTGAVLTITLGLAAPVARATDELPRQQGLSLWNDPDFQKRFMGSYGTNAELEPRVTAVEREKMEGVLEKMQQDPPDVEGAIAELTEILKPPTRKGEAEASAVFDFTLGNIWFQQEEMDKAAECYRNAIEKFPSFRRALKNLGSIYVRRGKFSEAIGAMSRVVELGGGDGLTYGLLGYAYSSTGQYVPAESAYRNAVLLDPETLDWKLGLTMSVLKQQRYGEAATLCAELLDKFPDNADYWLLQANAYIGLGKPLEAAKNFEVVRRMGKATPDSLETLGDIYVNQSLWDVAASRYEEAIEADPGRKADRALRKVEILAQRGAVPEAQGLLSAIKTVYEGRLDEDENKRLLKLEARMAVAEGQGEDAANVLEQVVALDPLDGEALLLLGQHYADNDDPEQAMFYYERAEGLDKFEAEARIRHAQLLVGQSRYQEAVPLLKRAQEIEPRDDVARFLEQVERVARSRR